MSLRHRVALLAAVTAIAVAGCGGGGSPSRSLTAAEGQALMEKKCTECHSLDRINGAIYDKSTWEYTVGRMEVNGLVVSPAEKQAIIDYLAKRDAAR